MKPSIPRSYDFSRNVNNGPATFSSYLESQFLFLFFWKLAQLQKRVDDSRAKQNFPTIPRRLEPSIVQRDPCVRVNVTPKATTLNEPRNLNETCTTDTCTCNRVLFFFYLRPRELWLNARAPVYHGQSSRAAWNGTATCVNNNLVWFWNGAQFEKNSKTGRSRPSSEMSCYFVLLALAHDKAKTWRDLTESLRTHEIYLYLSGFYGIWFLTFLSACQLQELLSLLKLPVEVVKYSK